MHCLTRCVKSSKTDGRQIGPMQSLYLLLRELFFMLGYVKNASAFPKPLTAEQERACLIAMRNGDLDAKHKLIEHNMRLVVHIAKKYAAGRDMDDLISCGAIGLIKAVSTFDPEKGAQLATYASRCIQNEILMQIRSSKKQRNEISLQEPIGADSEGNELSLLDILHAETPDVDEAVIHTLRMQRIRALIQRLPARERSIMTLRYGLGGGVPLTQKQTGDLLGISRSYVSRIEKKALQNLARMLQ